VHLEIIATTYRLMIIKTHVFSLYSPQCIYISSHLHTVNLDWVQAALKCDLRCAWKWQSSELRDALGGHEWDSLEMHLGGHDHANLEAIIKWVSSAKCKIVRKSQLNNSATLTRHSDPSRCSQMLPERLSAKQWALRCSETTLPVLFNAPEVVE